MVEMSDKLIVGGGVMGLLLARHLLQAGATVTLLEAGQCGREASWAGGGIVSPLYPWRYDPAVTALARPASRLFPPLCEALYDETGIDPEYTRTGLLMLDAQDADTAQAWAAQEQLAMTACQRGAFPTAANGCGENFEAGLWMPAVANVRNPRLLQALRLSALRHPAFKLHEFEPVRRVDVQAGRVESDRQVYQAEQVIVCAGAWTGVLLEQVGVSVPVVPVCGQMLLYRLPPGTLNTMLLHEGRYLIPRRDGFVLAGSTLEHTGFSRVVTTEANAALHAAAVRMLPLLADQKPVRQWAGLRPGSPAGIPFMGALPGGRVWVCAGHFRNGLVLAPASTQLLADCLLGRAPLVNPAPYAITLPCPVSAGGNATV